MIPIAEPALDGNELAYLTECIRTGWVSSKGHYVKCFEDSMAAFCSVRHGIATSSGTSALHLALLALGIAPGDEVIVPALTYVASANAIAYIGARPVFVDVDPDTWNINLTQVEAKITPRTTAIIPVHLYGHPVDMDALMAIADEHGLAVVEDACEAHGSEYKGRRVGALGHVGCFSFYGNKVVTTGEGGMLVTDSEDIATAARSLRNQATVTEDEYWHSHIGFSYRLTNLQAAVGVAQLERVSQFVAARQHLVQLYNSLLNDTPGLSLYAEPSWSNSVCWLYSLLVKDEFGMSRDELIAHLAERGVETKPFFVPLPSLPAYRDGQSYPVADRLSQSGISLPTSVKLQPQQIEYVARVIKEASRSKAPSIRC